jgi:hypothetical protein
MRWKRDEDQIFRLTQVSLAAALYAGQVAGPTGMQGLTRASSPQPPLDRVDDSPYEGLDR